MTTDVGQAPSNDATSDPEWDDALPPRVSWRLGLVVAAILAVLGAAPLAFGLGPFGARLALAGTGAVHVLNTSGQDLTVDVSFAAPVVVPAGTMEVIETLRGRVTLIATAPDGSVVETLVFDAGEATFYNAAQSACLVVVDLTDVYGGEGVLRVHERVPREQALIHQASDVWLLPRRTPPEQAAGTVHMLEVVGCNLLAQEEEAFLLSQVQFRLEERRRAYQEALREAREGGR